MTITDKINRARDTLRFVMIVIGGASFIGGLLVMVHTLNTLFGAGS